MGNKAVIKEGEIQVMSAGTGIAHSEFNNSPNEKAKFLQIWVVPNKRNVEPRYDQIALDPNKQKNKLQQILSPIPEDEGVWIHQNAWFHKGVFSLGFKTDYQIKAKSNGVYAFVLKGSFEIDQQKLGERDGLGIWDTAENIDIIATSEGAELLLMDVPMNI
jgi:redox-sensitive bicupin YhaK (pirin superfamily)